MDLKFQYKAISLTLSNVVLHDTSDIDKTKPCSIPNVMYKTLKVEFLTEMDQLTLGHQL